MPAAETGVHPPAAELDCFLELATREVKTAVGAINMYVALLDAQIAYDPRLGSLREIVRDVREQAYLVTALVDEALLAASKQSL
jgi:hypothetical protein